jgi:OOP family OmpA-OmpF porin
MIFKFRTMALAASSILMMGAAAQAADLYSPAPMPAYTGGWYFSGFGGANWLDSTTFDIQTSPPPITVINEYETGFVVGGAIGYDFGQAMGPLGMRFEAEISYRDNDVDIHRSGGNSFPESVGSTSALAGMGNLLFDLNTGSAFTIYGGGGLGVANVEFDGHGTAPGAVLMSDDDTVFAWQAIAGVGYEISPGWMLDVQYRYFNATGVSLTAVNGASSSTDYESHAVLGGIRIKF